MQRFKSQTRPKPFYTFRHIAVSRISSIALLLRLDRRAHDLVAPVPLQHHRQHQDDRHHVHLPPVDFVATPIDARSKSSVMSPKRRSRRCSLKVRVRTAVVMTRAYGVWAVGSVFQGAWCEWQHSLKM
eukprot:6186668-Pleurochrysis_carterae.AAC.1